MRRRRPTPVDTTAGKRESFGVFVFFFSFSFFLLLFLSSLLFPDDEVVGNVRRDPAVLSSRGNAKAKKKKKKTSFFFFFFLPQRGISFHVEKMRTESGKRTARLFARVQEARKKPRFLFGYECTVSFCFLFFVFFFLSHHNVNNVRHFSPISSVYGTHVRNVSRQMAARLRKIR